MFERLISHLIGNSKPNHSSSQSGIVAPGRGRHRGIGRMRRAFFYQPLACLLVLLLLPLTAWKEGASGGPFQAVAQSVGSCATDTSANTNIIRNYCNAAGTVAYFTDLTQLEADAVSAYLAMDGLPASDAPLIYTHGRKDVRSAIRALMLSTLVGIAKKQAASRKPHEQALNEWFSSWVQANEVALYEQALNHFNSFQTDPCRFVLDAELASTYKLEFDGTPFCFGGSISDVFSTGPAVPSVDYFKAYGLRHSYGKPAETDPNFVETVSATSVDLPLAIGVGASMGAIIAAAAGVTLAASFSAALSAFTVLLAAGTSLTGSSALFAGFVLSGSTVSTLGGVAAAVAAPVAIILIAVAIGVTAGIQVFTNQANIDAGNGLNALLTQARSTPPDLYGFASDTSGLGMYKLVTTFSKLTSPERPGTAPLPAHRAGLDPDFRIGNSVSSNLTYQDWDGNTWSAQMWNGWFVQTCTGAKCKQTESLNNVLQYVDDAGGKWMAIRFGDNFVRVKQKPADTDKNCPADVVTKVSAAVDVNGCMNYTSASIVLRDGNGGVQTVSVLPLGAPAFTTPATLGFSPGISASKTIAATGNPLPTVCLTSASLASLPAGFTGGSCGPGSVQLNFNGSSTPNATFSVQAQASNGIGSPVLQTFNVNVSTQLAIVSPGSFAATVGQPVSFLVVATGNPAPKLSMTSGWLPDGLSLTDNGNGTGTISGTVTQAVNVLYSCPVGQSMCGVIATSSQGMIVQSLRIDLTAPPSAHVAPPTSATFYTGIRNYVTVSTVGNTTPITSWLFDGDRSAPWLNGVDNHDGTFTLFGQPPFSAGTYTVQLFPAAQYSLSIGTNYTVTVSTAPIFLSPNVATFTVGASSEFLVEANRGSIQPATEQALPAGLTLTPNVAFFNPNSNLSGVPAPGAGGQYQLLLTADAGDDGKAQQTLTINVNEAPKIISPNTATFITGTPGSWSVLTTGFPSNSTHPIAPNPLPPTNPADGNGMYFSATGLPAGLTVSNLNAQSFASGTLTIQGAALVPGLYPVTVSAQNGVGSTAQQSLMLNVVTLSGPAPVSGSACNGNYNGSFSGTLTVSFGQNCSFLGGAVNGNINVQGGTLSLNGTRVTGNVSLKGNTAFSLGTGTTISGTLTIRSIASGATANRICGSTVGGNFNVSQNATAVNIGLPDTACFGNSFGGNVALTDNTSVTLYGNTIEKNLSCSGNVLIVGAYNSAAKKTDQCTAF